jgi:RNA polymerase sigma-70 factor (ECF subfamily)
MTDSEQQAVKKAAAGDRLAFRELVLEHSHAMFRLAWRLTCDESLAEDVVQEAFIKAWRKLGDFRQQSSFRTWLHRITVNTAMDHLRKQSRHEQMETREPDWAMLQDGAVTPRHDVQIDVQACTQAAMLNLSDTERTALTLRHFEGHSINEIAQILDLTTNACKQTIFRAVKKMRVELKPLVAT